MEKVLLIIGLAALWASFIVLARKYIRKFDCRKSDKASTFVIIGSCICWGATGYGIGWIIDPILTEVIGLLSFVILGGLQGLCLVVYIKHRWRIPIV
ncbi:MAG: hypothetical protein WC495_01235 [Patescibacteria group bacterium]